MEVLAPGKKQCRYCRLQLFLVLLGGVLIEKVRWNLFDCDSTVIQRLQRVGCTRANVGSKTGGWSGTVPGQSCHRIFMITEVAPQLRDGGRKVIEWLSRLRRTCISNERGCQQLPWRRGCSGIVDISAKMVRPGSKQDRPTDT
ncbi:unnamed protein product, partial [Nesidiocoris tenuis]